VESCIEGVIEIPLKIIEDDRGAVMHMLRADSKYFTVFGEVYFSQVNPGVIKGWKRHRHMTQRFAVPVGKIKIVIYDDRKTSRTNGKISEFVLGRPDAYRLLIIPPMVWYSFKGMFDIPSILANCSDLPHDPNETDQIELKSISTPNQW